MPEKAAVADRGGGSNAPFLPRLLFENRKRKKIVYKARFPVLEGVGLHHIDSLLLVIIVTCKSAVGVCNCTMYVRHSSPAVGRSAYVVTSTTVKKTAVYTGLMLSDSSLWHDMTWHDMTWHDMTWHDMMWYDVTWYDMIWYDMIWYDMIWYDMIFYWGNQSVRCHVTWLLFSEVCRLSALCWFY